MPTLLSLSNHCCLWTSRWTRVEKLYTTFRMNGSQVQGLWLVITCAFLSQTVRKNSGMSCSFSLKCKRAQEGDFILIQIRKEKKNFFFFFTKKGSSPAFSYALYYIRDICGFASNHFPYCVFFFFLFLIMKTYYLFGVIVLLRKWLWLHSQLQMQGRGK